LATSKLSYLRSGRSEAPLGLTGPPQTLVYQFTPMDRATLHASRPIDHRAVRRAGSTPNVSMLKALGRLIHSRRPLLCSVVSTCRRARRGYITVARPP